MISAVGVACDACGVLDEQATDRIIELEERIALLEETQHELNDELGRKRIEISRLRGEQDRGVTGNRHYRDACEVLDEWARLLKPNARETHSVSRLRPTLARLNGGYTKDELIVCIYGYSRMPYVTDEGRSAVGAATQWHADVDLIFKDAKHVDAGMRMADAAPKVSIGAMARVIWSQVWKANKTLIRMTLQREFGPGIHDEHYRCTHWPCPRCEARQDPTRPSMPLRLYDSPKDGPDGLVLECSNCRLNEARVLMVIASMNGGGLINAIGVS